MREDVLKLLAEHDSVSEAAAAIYAGPKKMALYVIEIGLESLKARKRRERRRELRRDLQPNFKSGRTTGSVVLTTSSKKRLLRQTQELFGEGGWQIGDLNLGDMTKEQLVAQAAKERHSAKGSIRNAQLYESLAEPLKPGQIVRDYWRPAAAHKVKEEIWKDTRRQQPQLM